LIPAVSGIFMTKQQLSRSLALAVVNRPLAARAGAGGAAETVPSGGNRAASDGLRIELADVLGQDPRIVLPGIPIARRDGSWNLRWNFDQYLYVDPSDAKRGWGVFARAGLSDANPNPLHWNVSCGIGGTSPLRGRESDRFGIGWYYGAVGSDLGKTSIRSIRITGRVWKSSTTWPSPAGSNSHPICKSSMAAFEALIRLSSSDSEAI
jgi:hypothetical protein